MQPAQRLDITMKTQRAGSWTTATRARWKAQQGARARTAKRGWRYWRGRYYQWRDARRWRHCNMYKNHRWRDTALANVGGAKT